MKHGIAGAILASLVLVATPVSAEALKEFGCGRMLEAPGGLPQLTADDHLHVIEQTSANARFDAGPVPPGMSVKSIFCARSDIVPAPSDYKVVQAGYPLTIFARDSGGKTRIAVLELDGGGKLSCAGPAAGPVLAVIAPSRVSVFRQRPERPEENIWPGQVSAVDLMGDRVRVRMDGKPAITAEVPPAAVDELKLDDGGELWACVDSSAITVYPP